MHGEAIEYQVQELVALGDRSHTSSDAMVDEIDSGFLHLGDHGVGWVERLRIEEVDQSLQLESR